MYLNTAQLCWLYIYVLKGFIISYFFSVFLLQICDSDNTFTGIQCLPKSLKYNNTFYIYFKCGWLLTQSKIIK